MYTAPLIRIADNLRKEIEEELVTIGILCRVFGRGKSEASLHSKLKANPGKYSAGGKLIQDAIGIRVALYFPEDVQIVSQVLRSKYEYDDASSTIDMPVNTVFSVTRHNLIFRLPARYANDVVSIVKSQPIDSSFEVQIRTVLSEGWHEVEHDLRYKRKNDWLGADDLSRGLNGVLATLETAEWSMRKIFDDLAYKHYKAKKWDGLIHAVLRMRIAAPLSSSVSDFLEKNADAARSLLRLNRMQIFQSLSQLTPRIPLTADNIVFVWNRIHLKNSGLGSLTPKIISDTMDNSEI